MIDAQVYHLYLRYIFYTLSTCTCQYMLAVFCLSDGNNLVYIINVCNIFDISDDARLASRGQA